MSGFLARNAVPLFLVAVIATVMMLAVFAPDRLPPFGSRLVEVSRSHVAGVGALVIVRDQTTGCEYLIAPSGDVGPLMSRAGVLAAGCREGIE